MHAHPSSPIKPSTLLLLVGLAFGLTACGPKEAAPPPVPATPVPRDAKSEPAQPNAPQTSAPPATAKAVTPAAAKAASPEVASKATPASAPGPGPAPSPTPEPKPSTPPPALKPAQPAPATSPVSDPGGEVAVKPAKAGLSRVGTAACKMCHRIQFASWSDTPHAKRTPPLDCEGCHGPGSEYKAMSIMKDPAKAKAAGLVEPGAPFCATCHKRNWNDSMLKRAHAHKG